MGRVRGGAFSARSPRGTVAKMPALLHPRLIRAAKNDPTLAYMIQNGLPLTREQWMSLNWPDGPPHPRSIEHEMEVPEFWQNPDKVEAEAE